ncbi:carbohydrate porin [Trichormus azollae]|uniref:carbohydrate porin n=1 Tax=Trichormus azollae TaxID=1164 RepID=UPI00325EB344
MSLSAKPRCSCAYSNRAYSNIVRREDLEKVAKLSEQFAVEFSVLGGRIDSLEFRIGEIQSQQFSTTTKLAGQVIFGIATGTGGAPPGRGEANTIFTQLTQL